MRATDPTRGRRREVYALVAVLVLGSLVAIVRDDPFGKELWPFSAFPMYSNRAGWIARSHRLFGVLREVTESDVEPPDPSSPQLSFALAGKVELSSGEKLMLLRELSERRRIELVHELLEHAVLAARRVRKAAERAVTNGKVDLG